MTTIAISRELVAGLSDPQRLALSFGVPLLSRGLGASAIYTDGGREFMVFDDYRITLDDVCVGAKVLATLVHFPDFDPTEMTPLEIAAHTRAFASARGLVAPPELALSEEDNPFTAYLAANGADGSLLASSGLPVGLSPVDSDL
jgi:hypothetical protein